MDVRRLGVALVLVLAFGLAGCAAQPPNPDTAKRLDATPSSATLRVTVAGGCLADLGQALDVRNPDGPTNTLLPDGATPDAALICRYGTTDLNDKTQPKVAEGDLAGHTDLTGDEATRLAAALQRLSLAVPTGIYNCPMELGGSAGVIAFHFPGRPDVDLWYHTTGCRSIDNGHVSAFQPSSRALDRYFFG